ncbi:MAG: tRNA pseudouridine(55) synthase TruB [Alphaproteobacteria bacterium]|nr:tRNA pseudouridine(55) synthase TruB [Alphaproteobacteria bacterium]
MGRRKRGTPVHGWLVLDKPEGVTSTRAVSMARAALNAEKAGHAGTLDPLASGILPIAFGEATKTVPWLVDATKVYRFVAAWGEQRATDDREGEVVATSDVRPSAEEIRAALPRFVGSIEQVPPAYSAVKVAGERAYDLARAGEEVSLAPRVVEVHAFELVEVMGPDRAAFEIECGKGTYVRSLVRDLARALGTVGHVAEIRRLSVGAFREADAVPLSNLAEMGNSARATSLLRPLQTALDDIPALAMGQQEATRLRRGQGVILRPAYAAQLEEGARARTGAKHAGTGGLSAVEELLGEDDAAPTILCSHILCTHKGQAVAICRLDGRELQPVRVFNLPWTGDADVDYPDPQAGAD